MVVALDYDSTSITDQIATEKRELSTNLFLLREALVNQ